MYDDDFQERIRRVGAKLVVEINHEERIRQLEHEVKQLRWQLAVLSVLAVLILLAGL